MRIAILQPTYLPWLGWFDIVDQVDCLILLDDVAFSKQSWQQRNRLRTLKGLEYVSVPVRSAGRSGQKISEVQFVDDRFVGKLERLITGSYARAPYLKELLPSFSEVLRKSSASGQLSELNTGLIEWFCKTLGISTPRQLSSKLRVSGKRGERVSALCEQVGAREYLSPAGSEVYLLEDLSAFEQRQIEVALHIYEHPVYRQTLCPFLPFVLF